MSTFKVGDKIVIKSGKTGEVMEVNERAVICHMEDNRDVAFNETDAERYELSHVGKEGKSETYPDQDDELTVRKIAHRKAVEGDTTIPDAKKSK